MVTVVARGPVSEGPAVLAQVAGVDQRHHVLVPASWPRPRPRCRVLIGGLGPGSDDVIGRGAPDGQAEGDGRPEEAVLLQLAVVDAAVGQLGTANQDTPLEQHQLVT